MTVVRNTLVKPGGLTPWTNAKITVAIIGSGFKGGGVEIISTSWTLTDASTGQASFDLEPSSSFPDGSYYAWRNPDGKTWPFLVPDGAGPFELDAVLATDPALTGVGMAASLQALADAIADEVARSNDAYVLGNDLSSLGVWMPEKYGGGVGVSDNTAAINDMIADQKANGGHIRFKTNDEYHYLGQLDFTLVRQCVVSGTSGPTAYATGTQLVYDGTGTAPPIITGSSTGLKFENLHITYSDTGFTGRMVDTKAVTNDTQHFSMEYVGLSGPIGGVATLLRIDKSHTFNFKCVSFTNFGIGVEGLETFGVSYSNGIHFDTCHWVSGGTIACVKNPGSSWEFTVPVAEALVSGAGIFVYYDAGFRASGLDIATPWFGDASAAGAWISPCVDGVFLHGGRISLPNVAGAKAVDITVDNTAGVLIYGTRISLGALATGVDFNATVGHVNWHIFPSWQGTGTRINNVPATGGMYDIGGGVVLAGPTLIGPIFQGDLTGADSITVGSINPNRVTANQANPTTTAGFQTNSNASALAAAAGVGDGGFNAIQWAATAAGDTSIHLAVPSGAVPVTARQQYALAVSLERAGGTGNGRFEGSYVDGSGTQVTGGAVSAGTVALSAGHNRLSIATTAPPGSVALQLTFRVLGATLGELCTISDLTVNLGTDHTFGLPGGTTTTVDGDGVHSSTGAAIDLTTPGLVAITGLDAASQKVTHVADGTAATDAVSLGQIHAGLTARTRQTVAGTYTWTNPSPSVALPVWIRGQSAHNGGGSGRRGAAGTIRSGGGGGAAANPFQGWFLTTDLPSTVSYTVGAGGTAGAAVTTDDTDGNPGGTGGSTFFGAALTTYWCGASNSSAGGGRGGTNAGGTGGVASAGAPAGGLGSATGLLGGAGGNATLNTGLLAGVASGAGAGAGLTAANATSNGGASGSIAGLASAVAGGVAPGGAGTAGAAPPSQNHMQSGTGGAGGASGTGAGGAGGSAPNGPGGGGAASPNGFNSGPGGTGGDGWIEILTLS